MGTEIIAGILASIAAVVAAVIGVPRINRDPLISIHKQIDIYNALPDSSPARRAILKRVEQQIQHLDDEDTARRNPAGIALGVSFLVTAVGIAGVLMTAGVTPWWFLGVPAVAFFALCGFIGLLQNAVSVPRAANGQSLEYQRRQAEKLTEKTRKQA